MKANMAKILRCAHGRQLNKHCSECKENDKLEALNSRSNRSRIAPETDGNNQELGPVGRNNGSAVDRKTTVFCANSGYFDQVNDVYREYFPIDPPASTFVTVGSWPMAFDIEIECIAIK